MKTRLVIALMVGLLSSSVVYADTPSPADQNKQAGAAFLSKNAKNKDVVTLKDGLQYKIIDQGKGEIPSDGGIVTVEYTGKLIDGTIFDSTKKHGGPANFRINEVIPGWTEALKLMPVGSTWEIYIPSNLAYGEEAPDVIGPNQTLIFTVKLINFKKDDNVIE